MIIGSVNFDDNNPDVNDDDDDDDDDGHGWCCKEGAADWRVALAGMVASPPGGYSPLSQAGGPPLTGACILI